MCGCLVCHQCMNAHSLLVGKTLLHTCKHKLAVNGYKLDIVGYKLAIGKHKLATYDAKLHTKEDTDTKPHKQSSMSVA